MSQTENNDAAEIIRLREEREQLTAERLKSEAEAERLSKETKQLKLTQAINQAVADTGIGFYPSPSDLTKLLDGRAELDDSGALRLRRADGSFANFTDAVKEFAMANRWALKNPGPIVEEKKFESRADFDTLEEKISYIDRFGLRAWEKLPLTTPPKQKEVKDMCAEDYVALPTKAKIEIVNRYGTGTIEQIMSRHKKESK
jgi:hypothetical protein